MAKKKAKKKVEKKEKSEFGRGLVICLVKFAEHFENDMATAILRKADTNTKKDHARVITTWANGASDHLYDMEIPKGSEGTPGAKKVAQLKKLGLEIGHGFTGKTYTVKDFNRLRDLTREIALCLDNALGLDPDIGEW